MKPEELLGRRSKTEKSRAILLNDKQILMVHEESSQLRNNIKTNKEF